MSTATLAFGLAAALLAGSALMLALALAYQTIGNRSVEARFRAVYAERLQRHRARVSELSEAR